MKNTLGFIAVGAIAATALFYSLVWYVGNTPYVHECETQGVIEAGAEKACWEYYQNN